MRRARVFTALAVAFAGSAGFVQGSGPSAGSVGTVDAFSPAAEPAWNQLTYRASKLFVTLDATVTLDRGADAEDLVRPPAERLDGLKPLGAGLVDHRLSVETSVLGRRALETVLFDGDTGRAVQRYKRRFGGKSYSKTHRFLDRGVFLLRLAPGDGQSPEQEAAWTRRQETLYPAPGGAPCPVVVDPVQVFYMLSTASLHRAGDAFETCVFSKRGYARMRAEVTGSEARRADYRLDGTPVEAEEAEVLRIALRSTPLDGSDSKDSFELMGLEGDLEVFVEKEHRLPIEICGDHSKAGAVSIRLQEAGLTPSSS